MPGLILLKIKGFFKKAGYKLYVFILVFSLAINPFLINNFALAATLNPGSSFTVCTGEAVQPFYTSQASPTATVYWIFTSAANTQAIYQVQIDDDAAFGSINVDSGAVSNAAARAYTTSSLSFGVRYYWRIQVTDNLSSVTDWVSGDSFITLRQSLMLKGNIKLWGNVQLK